MKGRIIRISVLTVVFIVALIVSSHYTNRGNTDMAADMGQATLPSVSFQVNGQRINLLPGHLEEMAVSAMRETITPLSEDGSLTVNVEAYEQKIKGMSYEIFTKDGGENLLSETIQEVSEAVTIETGDVVTADEEYIFKIHLELGTGESVHYYTRIVKEAQPAFLVCMDYVQALHDNIRENADEGALKKVMESNEQGDNTTLQHVTIHSDLEHITWGKLQPEIIGEVLWSVQEIKSAYTSIQLQYRVKCAGDNNAEEEHIVKEFFRVNHTEGENYLLTYDRTMEELFDGNNVVLTSKGINIGLTTDDMRYKANEAGDIVAFVQANELWSYNKEEDEFALVFSFADSEKEDIRNWYDGHSVKILSMEENGNVTFAVYGYMNRGLHEGKSGAVIYYFNLSQNAVEEKAFIPSNQPYAAIEKVLGELAFYSDASNVLYVLADGTLCRIDMETFARTTLLEGLEKDQYVSSDDGHLIAYQKQDAMHEAVVLNFATGTEQAVSVAEGEILRPLGFVQNDFVYGAARTEDAGKTSSGDDVLGMYKLEIRDTNNELVKTYQIDDSYLLKIQIHGNMITLDRAIKQDGTYVGIAEDYIANNEEKQSTVELQSYWTDLKETQYRLVMEAGIDKKEARVLKPKQTLFEHDTTVALDIDMEEARYSVYGLGELVGVYAEAGEALEIAKDISGVVISPKQNYVWEDGNRVAWYRNFEISAFRCRDGESSLTASVRALLAYEDADVDAAAELSTKSVLDVLNEYCGKEAVRFEDCSVADMRYLIDKGTPVIGLTGSSEAIVLIGYDAVSVTYIDPSTGGIRMRNFAAVNELLGGGGNVFYAYVK